MKSYERRCVVCGQSETEVGLLSTRGLCEPCGIMLVKTNAEQMRDKSGPFYEHYARQRFLGARRAVVKLERGE